MKFVLTNIDTLVVLVCNVKKSRYVVGLSLTKNRQTLVNITKDIFYSCNLCLKGRFFSVLLACQYVVNPANRGQYANSLQDAQTGKLFDCPASLHFDEQKCRCDWPWPLTVNNFFKYV